MKHELVVPLTHAEIRQEGEAQIIEGVAVVYNQLSEPIGGYFREFFAPGSLTKTLAENRAIKSLWNHNTDYVLGSQKSGTLQLRDAEDGLHFMCKLPDTQWARDFAQSIKRGDVDQCSFLFDSVRDKWAVGSDGMRTREVLEARLYEVSPVTFPAYTQTSVSARAELVAEMRSSFDGMAPTDEDEEELRTLVAQLSSTMTIWNDDEEEDPDADQHTAPADGHPAPQDMQMDSLRKVGEMLDLIGPKGSQT